MHLKRILIFAVLVFPILTALYVYPWQQLTLWLMGREYRSSSLLLTLSLSIIVVPLALYSVLTSNTPGLKIAVELLGAGLITLLTIAVVAAIGSVVGFAPREKGLLVLVGASILISYALYKGRKIVVVERTIPIEGLKKPFRIVQLSDVHLGSRQANLLENLITKANELKPDAIVITGDLADTSFVEESDLTALKNANSPVLMCSGNHDHYVQYDDVIRWVRDRGVIVLENDHHTVNGIHFIGLVDQENPKFAVEAHNLMSFNEGPTVLLYHRPDIWQYIKQLPIHLTLVGHTHNGQIFPFNLLVWIRYREIKGLYQEGHSFLNVSQGSGTWGPTMRLGSQCEIIALDLVAKRQD